MATLGLTVTPSHPKVTLAISGTPTQLTITLTHLDKMDLKIDAFDASGPIDALMGAIVALILPKAVNVNKEITKHVEPVHFANPIGFSANLEGVKVDVSLATFALDTYQGMLLATGTLDVT